MSTASYQSKKVAIKDKVLKTHYKAKADPTTLSEYTNSYLGLDVLLNHQKSLNALRG